MATYTQILYHLVFSTKKRAPVLDKTHRDDLYRFIWGMLRERQCHLHRIGGIEDHVHILISLHPTVALSDLIKEIKTASSSWIKGNQLFPGFDHWQEGYGAFTCSVREKAALIEYIRNQEQHHLSETYRQEYERLLHDADLVVDERDRDWQEDGDVPTSADGRIPAGFDLDDKAGPPRTGG